MKKNKIKKAFDEFEKKRRWHRYNDEGTKIEAMEIELEDWNQLKSKILKITEGLEKEIEDGDKAILFMREHIKQLKKQLKEREETIQHCGEVERKLLLKQDVIPIEKIKERVDGIDNLSSSFKKTFNEISEKIAKLDIREDFDEIDKLLPRLKHYAFLIDLNLTVKEELQSLIKNKDDKRRIE